MSVREVERITEELSDTLYVVFLCNFVKAQKQTF